MVINEPRSGKHSQRRTFAWFMGSLMVLAFVAGTMVDVDHPLAGLLGIGYGRFLHPYFALAGAGLLGIGIILAVACFRRLFSAGVLKKRR